MLHDKSDSEFLYHEPCPACSSKDNLGRYSDGHAHCFGCGHYEPGDNTITTQETPNERVELQLVTGSIQAIRNRGINEDTCRLFDYQCGRYDNQECHVANYRDENNKVAVQHIRFVGAKFKWLGNKSKIAFFGQHLWSSGKKLCVTEGELDCLSVSQVFGNKWPVVSLPNGAQSVGKYVKASYDWLCGFDEIILMFDMDEPGQNAAQVAAELLPVGKVKIAKLPMKDANECLVAGNIQAITSAFWNAETYRPDGIVSVRDIKDSLFNPVVPGVPWPWQEFTRLTHGRYKTRLYTFGAGVGIGKTDVFTECIAYDLMTLKVPVGVIYLEQPVQETVQRVCGKMKSKLFHVPDKGWTVEEYRQAVDELDAMEGLWLYQHFGGMDWDTIKQKIRYFNRALGIEHIYLDHLTALTSTADDERRALDRIMAEMASLAQELGLIIHIISHLTTPTHGKPHEEGGRVMENQFTGSRAIARWSHYMFGLERNKQAEDLVERRTTIVRILKDRLTGEADGHTLPLHYDVATGRLQESMF